MKNSTDIFCLDAAYSTTRCVTTEKPVIKRKPEDRFESFLFLPEGERRKGEGGLRTKGFFKKSLPDKPLITIVTVVFNGDEHLEKTMLSVINQTYDNVEYIIIDGGSTDGTLEIIKKYEDKIDYWISEKDEGIYDAMNKGIMLALGDIIGLINSDDWYSEKIFEKISQYYSLNSLIYGNLLTHFNSGQTYKHSIPIPKTKEEVRLSIVHPTVFTSKYLYKMVGLFDLSYKITSDYDLMIRMFLYGAKIVKINEVLVHFREGGASANGAGAIEGIKIAQKHNFSKQAMQRKILKLKVRTMKNFIKNKFGISR